MIRMNSFFCLWRIKNKKTDDRTAKTEEIDARHRASFNKQLKATTRRMIMLAEQRANKRCIRLSRFRYNNYSTHAENS